VGKRGKETPGSARLAPAIINGTAAIMSRGIGLNRLRFFESERGLTPPSILFNVPMLHPMVPVTCYAD